MYECIYAIGICRNNTKCYMGFWTWAWGTHGRDEKHKILVRKPEGKKDHTEDLDTDGKISEWILREIRW
jgi:hypothetical protein